MVHLLDYQPLTDILFQPLKVARNQDSSPEAKTRFHVGACQGGADFGEFYAHGSIVWEPQHHWAIEKAGYKEGCDNAEPPPGVPAIPNAATQNPLADVLRTAVPSKNRRHPLSSQ